MDDNTIKLWCKNCNKAFTTFLSEMAEHNGKVTCPGCQQTQKYTQADILKPSSQTGAH